MRVPIPSPIATTLDDAAWQLPACDCHELASRCTSYCVCIPVLNEGQRFIRQLEAMQPLVPLADAHAALLRSSLEAVGALAAK